MAPAAAAATRRARTMLAALLALLFVAAHLPAADAAKVRGNWGGGALLPFCAGMPGDARRGRCGEAVISSEKQR
jgi:hypothetical protein